MAVTRTLAELAGDLRLSDGASAPTGAVARVLGRIDETARTAVTRFAPDAPDAIHNEAYVRFSAWLYDADPTGQTPGGPKGLIGSGAAALLAPYRVIRGVAVAGEASSTEGAGAGAGAALTNEQVRALVYDWAEEGNIEGIPVGKLGAASGLMAIWARDGDTTAIPANKLVNAGAGLSPHYLGAWTALTANQRGAITIGQVVLRYNKFWIAASEAEARVHGPLDATADGWRCINEQFRGAAHSSARFYDVGDIVIGASNELYFCVQGGSFTADQISASTTHWFQISDASGVHWLGAAASAAKAYVAGDIVSAGGNLYFCTQAGTYTAAQVANSANWSNLTAAGSGGGEDDGFTDMGTWTYRDRRVSGSPLENPGEVSRLSTSVFDFVDDGGLVLSAELAVGDTLRFVAGEQTGEGEVTDITADRVTLAGVTGVNFSDNTQVAISFGIPAEGGGEGGLTAVSSDASLTGDGTSGSPLAVANPFTAADEAKLDGLEAGATGDQTAAEIVTALEGLSGDARLNASAIRDLPEGGGGEGGLTAVSSDASLTGDGTSGSPLAVATPVTGANIVTALEGLSGDARLNASAIRDLPEGGGTALSPAPVQILAKNFTVAGQAVYSLTQTESNNFIATLGTYRLYEVTIHDASAVQYPVTIVFPPSILSGSGARWVTLAYPSPIAVTVGVFVIGVSGNPELVKFQWFANTPTANSTLTVSGIR